MQSWWDILTAFERVMWLIALPFSVIFLIQMILTFIGFGGGSTDPGVDLSGDIHADITADAAGNDVQHSNTDTGPAFSLFTLRNFIAFFTVFGWSGIAFYHAGMSNGLSVLLAALLGVLAMLIISLLFYFIMKMAENGNVSAKNAIGAVGKVYLPIKAYEGNIGKVHVAFQGNLREMQAITRQEYDLPTNTIIKVAGISGNDILIVERNL